MVYEFIFRELCSRKRLDSYLSRALSIPLDEDGCLKIVDNSNYVLTLDFAIKMLNINERAECRMPVIIEGETGVGKTALVEMLSKLWNYSLSRDWMVQRSRMVDVIIEKIAGESAPNTIVHMCMYFLLHFIIAFALSWYVYMHSAEGLH